VHLARHQGVLEVPRTRDFHGRTEWPPDPAVRSSTRGIDGFGQFAARATIRFGSSVRRCAGAAASPPRRPCSVQVTVGQDQAL